MRKSGRGYRSAYLSEYIPHASNGLQELFLEGTIDFVAQSAHEHVDDVGLRVEVVLPDVREDHRLGYDLARIAHEVLEECEFTRPQVNRLIPTGDLARQEIERQISDAQRCRLRRTAGTADGRLHAR